MMDGWMEGWMGCTSSGDDGAGSAPSSAMETARTGIHPLLSVDHTNTGACCCGGPRRRRISEGLHDLDAGARYARTPSSSFRPHPPSVLAKSSISISSHVRVCVLQI